MINNCTLDSATNNKGILIRIAIHTFESVIERMQKLR